MAKNKIKINLLRLLNYVPFVVEALEYILDICKKAKQDDAVDFKDLKK